MEINKVIYKITWKNENMKKGTMKKNIQDIFELYGYYKQFQDLLEEFNK
jgi:hypothetical protein